MGKGAIMAQHEFDLRRYKAAAEAQRKADQRRNITTTKVEFSDGVVMEYWGRTWAVVALGEVAKDYPPGAKPARRS
jgi:hypothetical protein